MRKLAYSLTVFKDFVALMILVDGHQDLGSPTTWFSRTIL